MTSNEADGSSKSKIDNWKEYAIANIAKIKGGGTPSTKTPSYWNGNIPWITPKDLSIQKSKYIKRGSRNITEKGLSNSNANLIPPNSIILSTRAPIGYIAISRNALTTNQGCHALIPSDSIDTEFLYYLLKENVEFLKSQSNGSTFGELSGKTLRELKFLFPTLYEQKAIAKILSDLDSKIELNQKMNKTLEAIAQAIFKHWFIDFEFPNEEGRPYKSSGGEMVDSELGEIPSKWKIGRLIDLTLNFDSKRVPLSSREREARTGTYPYYGAASLLDFVDSYIFDGIYLLVGEDGTVIDEHGHPILQYVFGRFWVNNHAHVIQGKYPFSTEYVYLLLKQLNVKHIVTGAVQAKINQANLNSITVVIPPADLINVFNRLIEGVFSKLRLNKNEMDSLTELREILLPKLISGKIRVSLEE